MSRKDTVAARISKYLEVAPPSDAAQTADVIVGKQFITTGYAFQTGTMPDNGDLGTITPTTVSQLIPEGYTSGGTVVGDADLLPENIIDGVSIFGVLGTGGVPEGTAQPNEVLTGETFINAGGPQIGTMPNNGSLGTITPTTTNQSIPSGFTTGGTVAGSANLLAGNIRISTDIFGVLGTLDPGTQTGGDAVSADVLTGKTFTNDSGQQIGSMVNRAGDTAALSSTVVGTTLKLLPSGGYRDGTDDYVTITDADFIAANIKKDVDVLGVVGTFESSTVVGQTEETFEFSESISANDPVFIGLNAINKLSNPTTLPPDIGRSVTFSTDGVYMAVAHSTSPYLTIYKRSGDTFTKLTDPSSLPTGVGSGIVFSYDGIYLAVAHTTTPFVTIYKRSGDTFTKLSNPASLPTGNAGGVSFSRDGTYLSVVHTTSPFITTYKRSGDTFTKLADPSTLPTGVGRGVAFSPDGIYMAVAHDTTPFVTIYKRSSDTFTKLTNPSTLPTERGWSVDFSNDGLLMAVANETTPFVTIYKRSGDTFTKLADPFVLPAGSSRGVSFSDDCTYLAIVQAVTPYLLIYKRLGDDFVKVANPTTLPTGTGLGVDFSADGVYFSVAHDTTPFVSIFKPYYQCFKSNNLGNWRSTLKAGYAKEAGTIGQSKKVIITHR